MSNRTLTAPATILPTYITSPEAVAYVDALRARKGAILPAESAQAEAYLVALRVAHMAAHASLEATIGAEFPGRGEWDYLRAVAHLEGDNTRRNEDTADDAAMVASPAIKAAWDAYMAALHTFYRARDGEGGVLGGRA